MALLQLYESAAALVLPGAVYSEDFTTTSSSGWYMRRYDCVVVYNNSFGGCFKLYRSGKVVRVSRSALGSFYLGGYDANLDTALTIPLAGTVLNNDVVGMIYNPQDPSALTYTGVIVPSGHANPVVYGQKYYRVAGATVTSHNLATGATIDTYVLTGSIAPFGAERVDITDDGWLVGMDFDNGTVGVLRFYNLVTGEQYTSSVARAKFIWIDRVNKNVWVYRLSDSKLAIYTMQPAPATMSAVTMSANRARYREDTLSVTLTGSNGEVVPYWPVEWLMSTSEGHLEFAYTKTNASGVATNRYCGPGATDYVGASLTITARTGY